MKTIIKKIGLMALAVIGITMVFTTPSISIPSVGNGTQIAIQGVLLFIKIVGCIAFIRGLILLFKNISFPKGISQKGYIHLFGGIVSINIALIIAILGNNLKLGMFLLV